jgi:hypothetical protein
MLVVSRIVLCIGEGAGGRSRGGGGLSNVFLLSLGEEKLSFTWDIDLVRLSILDDDDDDDDDGSSM